MSSRGDLVAGPLAARALGTPGRGRIVAAFASVFYADLPGGIVCVARPGVAPGPLTLIADVLRTTDWRACGIAAGLPVVICAGNLRAGPVRMDTRPLRPWTPEPWAAVDPAQLGAALGRLRGARPPFTDGLAGFLDPHAVPAGHVARAAAAPLGAAGDWLAKGGETGWAQKLVGLGPGLTPSGDDVLGGMMLALHATGRSRQAESLFAAIAPLLATATNQISAALLAAAAEGLGSDPLHRAINRILADEDPALALAELARVGHSSGLDALVGVVAALAPLALPDRRAA